MSELRWNPLLGAWTMVAASRQNRPHMEEGKCPFCPSSGNVPYYDVLKYDNDFPALSLKPGKIKKVSSGVYRRAEAYGKCEVILYSPDHKKPLHELPEEHIEKIISLWALRCEKLSKDRKIKYVFPFENKGSEVGVTMIHPHGQIYAYPFVPLKLKTELDNAKEYYKKNKKCVICAMNREEKKAGVRVIHENRSFLAYLPYFTDYPYGVFISSKTHRPGITGLSKEERQDLAEALKTTEGAFDSVFNRPFPFMMCAHQCPVNSPGYRDSKKYFHLHIEFYPPLRAKDKIKYYASSESGAWAAANVARVEDTAKQLVSAKYKYFAATDKERFKKEFLNEFIKVFGGNDSPFPRPSPIKGEGEGSRGAFKEVRIFSAPARINIIGEHIDYNGGLVMPAAVCLNTYAAIRKRKDKSIIIKDINAPETIKFHAGETPVFDKRTLWANYPAGVLNTLAEAGHKIKSGFEVLFFSEIPAGAGISSSAAFEVVFAYALSKIFGFNIPDKELALLCRKAENEFVGVKCGIMDQFASALSKKGNAMLLNCATLEREFIPLKLGDYRIVIANTDKKRELAGSKYNERLAECMEGRADLKQVVDIKNLCDLNADMFEKHKNAIKKPVVLKRVRHAVYENERVKKAVDAMKQGDIAALGKLLMESHISLRDDYEVTGPELDAMFEEAIKQPGCLGGRMTGAGFGGCTINLVHKDAIFDFKANVAEAYRKRTGLTADFYECEAGDGVKEV
jgi:UDPglucose--hexose-1-phosphate uridylyltransferase